jgi:hypothetical protein
MYKSRIVINVMVLQPGFPPPDARRKRLAFPGDGGVSGAGTMDVTLRGHGGAARWDEHG